jgi:hypothetical protein
MNFNINAGHYIHLIKQINEQALIDFEKVKRDQVFGMNLFDKLNYSVKRFIIQTLKKLIGKRHD